MDYDSTTNVTNSTERGPLFQRAPRRRCARPPLLDAISKAALAGQGPHEIAQLAVSRMRRLVPGRCVCVMLFDFERDSCMLLATTAPDAPCLGPMGHCPLSAVPDIGKLLEGTCREVDDLAHAPQLTAMEQLALDAGILSYAMVPLMARGRLIGSLNLGAPDPGIYRPALLALARKIGDHLAIALRHSETDRALRQHNADLQQALMIRDQMVENVSRELRTPLTQLVRCGELLRDGVLGGGFNDEETRALTAIIEEGRALARLVDALLSLKAPGGAAGPSSTVEDRAKSFTGALPRWQRGPKTGS